MKQNSKRCGTNLSDRGTRDRHQAATRVPAIPATTGATRKAEVVELPDKDAIAMAFLAAAIRELDEDLSNAESAPLPVFVRRKLRSDLC
ncbi:MAG: hypothetical protein HYY84_19755 [Deltaproteobacteria bacterium]|nr:hypothetical protein [Deltaproteobacteria bacterium]